ncbi:ATP-binding protein [uncultured Proteiniphilum sp.]|uniref:hybrid sensor histidine kinase/response regulator n=1 Tax=uncultured Proteiniphilum sp. TaxID=497637 RepID=UPI0026047E21|nr:ATP-binding protein [uncultured Proteiniphilum sp.]
MEPKGILHDDSQAVRLLKMTCDTLLFLKNDGTCIDMIVKTENNPYVNNQYTLLGKNIFDYFPEETVRELKPAVEHVVRTGEVSNANYNLPSQDKMFFFKCIIQKYDEEHVLCQYRDITKRSQMKKSLQMANERLTETGRAAKLGYWSYDTSTKIFRYSGHVGILMDKNEEVVMPLEKYMEYVYPEDRRKLEDILERRNFGQGTFEYRIIKDKIYYLRLKIVNILHTNNGVMIIDGYTQNIDDIVSKWDELKMVTLAMNNSNDNIYATKMDGTLIFANQLCRKQNQISEDIDITKYKAYEVLENFTDKQRWDNFIHALRANNNSLKYICNHPYPRFNVISSDCYSFIIRNEYGEEIIWHLLRDISEQLRYEDQLKKAKEKAEESDRLKTAFLSNMSHEIRTPLNAIVGFSGIMADIDDSQERKKFHSIIESSNKRLLLLIDEVLDLSKIESGTLEFDYTPVKVNDLYREIFMTHQLYAKHASLVLELPDEDICLKTDKNRLTQVISNLINNAVKFTPKGTITLGYRRVDDFVELYVKDTGIGIKKDKLNKIFNRFVKVDPFAPGTGLGLSICKTIIERLGGDISVTSEEGVGSLFSFRIPILPADSEDGQIQAPLMSKPLLQHTEKEKATILVAEDIDDNFELIQVMIGSQYHLLHAKDGNQAVDLFDKYHADLILMDIKMPEMNGLEAIRNIRRKSPYSPPIIAVSAYAYEDDKKELLDSGCNDFVTKPLDKDILLATINKYL